jgi:predicted DNA-binding transcriptional regulator AlpA
MHAAQTKRWIQNMQLTNTNEQMLSRRHLAARWAISKETLKRREKAGLLPFLKLGRDVRYRLADIEQIEAQAEIRL